MLNQRGRAIEGLAAIWTAVGAARQVGACVDGQHRALTKALAALRALERLLTGCLLYTSDAADDWLVV